MCAVTKAGVRACGFGLKAFDPEGLQSVPAFHFFTRNTRNAVKHAHYQVV